MSTRGSSLPETLVALGLLAGAILATIGLVVLGSRRVESAERASRALAAGASVLERIESRGFRQTWMALGCDGLRPVCVADSGDAAVFPWSELFAAGPPAAGAEITLRALDASSLSSARSIRVAVVVSWTEGVRGRSVRLVTIRN